MRKTHTPDLSTLATLRTITASLPAGRVQIEGTPVPLPEPVAALLRDMLAALAAGEPVTVVTQDVELAPHEAAELLNVSRGTITTLIEAGTLPHRLIGDHRRIPAVSVAALKAQQERDARIAMDELARLSQATGDYSDPPANPLRRDTTGGSRGD